jgi:hypothetical protein
VITYLTSLENETRSTPTADPARAMRALSKAARTFDTGTVQAALEHDPKRGRAAVKSLIEVLSSVGGLRVAFLESEIDAEDAGPEGEIADASEGAEEEVPQGESAETSAA